MYYPPISSSQNASPTSMALSLSFTVMRFSQFLQPLTIYLCEWKPRGRHFFWEVTGADESRCPGRWYVHILSMSSTESSRVAQLLLSSFSLSTLTNLSLVQLSVWVSVKQLSEISVFYSGMAILLTSLVCKIAFSLEFLIAMRWISMLWRITSCS